MYDSNNPHLARTLSSNGAPSDAEGDSTLPTLKDGEYQPHARPSNKPLQSLHFVTPGGDVRSFQYAHLDSDSTFAAGRIALKFMGMTPVRVVIEGQQLWRLYDYLHQHRMPWIMSSAREFAASGQTAVTRITFSAISDGE